MTKFRRNPVVLVVDDSEQDVTLIRAAFQSASKAVELRSASSAEGARAYLTGGPPFADRVAYPAPDLVLLDIQMPIEDGLQVLRWIRAQEEPWRRVPVVMLTTSHDYNEIRKAYDLGANSFLVKPTGFHELNKLILHVYNYWLMSNRIA
jgi:CheY-like chemotaxis protein